MKKENVLHKEIIKTRNKTYFLDLKKAENGSNYLVVTQSTKTGDEPAEKVRMLFFENELQQFGAAMSRILFQFKPRNNSEEYKEKVRKDFPNAFNPWTETDDFTLKAMVEKKNSTEDIAEHFKRKTTAIEARIKKLNLVKTAADVKVA